VESSSDAADRLRIGVALKWVARQVAVDPLTGEATLDPFSYGLSEANEAALEWALQLAGEGETVAATCGPPEVEGALRQASAAGAQRLVRVDPAPDRAGVAAGLAGALAGCDLVVCGEWSADRGSGAVPALLAAHLGAAQALGALSIERVGRRAWTVVRRLDRGAREVVRVTAPAVVSVAAASARLRRAPLDGVLAGAEASIDHRAAPPSFVLDLIPVASAPYRPRPRSRPGPTGTPFERIGALVDAGPERGPARLLTLPPDEAAAAIVEQLAAWGYLDGSRTLDA
jgi:electron transfer flavoprotein beta subunit